MAMVVVDDSSLKQADSQPKSGGLVWELATAWSRSTFIRWTEWTVWSWPQHYGPGYYYYYYYYVCYGVRSRRRPTTTNLKWEWSWRRSTGKTHSCCVRRRSARWTEIRSTLCSTGGKARSTTGVAMTPGSCFLLAGVHELDTLYSHRVEKVTTTTTSSTTITTATVSK